MHRIQQTIPLREIWLRGSHAKVIQNVIVELLGMKGFGNIVDAGGIGT